MECRHGLQATNGKARRLYVTGSILRVVSHPSTPNRLTEVSV